MCIKKNLHEDIKQPKRVIHLDLVMTVAAYKGAARAYYAIERKWNEETDADEKRELGKTRVLQERAMDGIRRRAVREGIDEATLDTAKDEARIEAYAQ